MAFLRANQVTFMSPKENLNILFFVIIDYKVSLDILYIKNLSISLHLRQD